jgi:hypothetical protein
MKNQDFYHRIVIRQQSIRRDKLFREWFKRKKLTGRKITAASFALASGKSKF